MDKQVNIAFVITCHKNVKQTNTFIRQLLEYAGSYVFVHIDKKAPFGTQDIIHDSRVFFASRRIGVSWGDVTQIESVILVLKDIVSCGIPIDYVSWHSESDLATRPIDDFAEYLNKSDKEVFLYCNPLPAKGWGHGGGFERIRLSYAKPLRQKVSHHHPLRYVRALYQIFYASGIIRGRQLPKDIRFYGGDGWFTVSMAIVNKSIQYLNSTQEFMDIFKHSLAGDEIFFSTLFIKFAHPDLISINDNLRYIDWSIASPAESGSPKTLQTEDIDRINQSCKFFARKFSRSVDSDIINYYLRKTSKTHYQENKVILNEK